MTAKVTSRRLVLKQLATLTALGAVGIFHSGSALAKAATENCMEQRYRE